MDPLYYGLLAVSYAILPLALALLSGLALNTLRLRDRTQKRLTWGAALVYVGYFFFILDGWVAWWSILVLLLVAFLTALAFFLMFDDELERRLPTGSS